MMNFSKSQRFNVLLLIDVDVDEDVDVSFNMYNLEFTTKFVQTLSEDSSSSILFLFL